MAELDDVERYRKLLEDWKPGPPASKKTSLTSHSKISPMAVTSQKPTHLDQVAKNQEPYGSGTILRLNGHTLAVYKKHVPEKDYHLVLILGPGGSVKVQGIALEAYQIEELGQIAPKCFETLQSQMRWERDLLVFHCYSYEDAAKIPRGETPAEENRPVPGAPAPAAVQPPAAPPPVPGRGAPEAAPPPQPAAPPGARQPELNGSMRRGQRLQIRFGNNFWDAVYWGHDDQGQVIAHKTYENWALMHLDLKRFANSMQVDPEADLNLVQEIEQNLLKP